MTFTESRPMGGAYVLDALWRRLGIATAIRNALAGRRADGERVERILRYLQHGAGHYIIIIGEKLRSTPVRAQAALSRQGRYATVADNPQVKEVNIDDAGDRFILCYNPEQALRDQQHPGTPRRPARRDHRRH